MPMGVVRACLRQLPVLVAEESLLTAERLGVGTGSLSKDNMKAITASWRKAALGDLERRKAPALPRHLMPGMGIGFHVMAKP